MSFGQQSEIDCKNIISTIKHFAYVIKKDPNNINEFYKIMFGIMNGLFGTLNTQISYPINSVFFIKPNKAYNILLPGKEMFNLIFFARPFPIPINHDWLSVML